MTVTLACIAGEEIHRQLDTDRIEGKRLGPRQTPYGLSGEIILTEAEGHPYYLLARHAHGVHKPAPCGINNRANLYALKDLGVRMVLGWGAGGAITHDLAVGDLVILSDVIDYTHNRETTFFECSPMGYLREFPVFCPTLRKVLGEVLHEMKLVYHGAGIAAVREGPRLETPAEIRMLATVGAELVTHHFVPEVFLAKELQLCYASVTYIVNYAETGSRHRPFNIGELFGGLTNQTDSDRLSSVVSSMNAINARLAGVLESAERICSCEETLTAYRREFNLGDDWHEWLT